MKKPALIYDIDGTVALRAPGPDGTTREWFDFDRVGEDVPNWPVVNLIRDMHRYHNVVANQPLTFIAVSGRPDTCYVKTSAWLVRHHIPCDLLLMRDPKTVDSVGNQMPDWHIKERIYRGHIEPEYEVLFVLDDRDSVVAQWRKMGLSCFQVAPGAF